MRIPLKKTTPLLAVFYQPGDAPACRALHFACSQCDRAFASQKALESHARVKHGCRMDIRAFVAGSICPACGTDSKQRLRCLAHLSDRRRTRCAEWVRTHCVRLAPRQVADLDEHDRLLRREARKSGKSHHIAVGPAITCGGRLVGRVSH